MASKELKDKLNMAIALTAKEGDVVTRKLFESILSDEEAHHNTFSTLLEKN